MSWSLRRYSAVVVLFSSLLIALPAHAAPIVAGTDLVPSVAVQTIDLLPGTPFNPGTEVLTVILTASGGFTLDRQAQTGTTIDFTIPQAIFSGVLPGPLPPLAFDLVAGVPGLNPTTGQITDVVQNPADPGFPTGNPSSFVSGDFRADTFFALLLPIGTLYSDPNQAAVFTGALAGLPLPEGTVLSSPDRLNIYFQMGPGFDPTRDPIVAVSYDRTVSAVPEPSAIVLLLGGAGILVTVRRCRPKSCE
jgi:hypothetical protein